MRSYLHHTEFLCSAAVVALHPSHACWAQGRDGKVILNRGGNSIVLEPYAPNIVRITLSAMKEQALAPPGYGFVAVRAPHGWAYKQGADGGTYSSSRLTVTVPALPQRRKTIPTSQLAIAEFFRSAGTLSHSGGGGGITVSTPDGKTLLDMKRWSMSPPDYESGNTEVLADRRSSDALFFEVDARFASPADEHYYGLGQNQQGRPDHRGQVIRCWSDYGAAGGEIFCVPFVITNKGYGMIWDNPSRTTIEAGFNKQTKWSSQVDDRVSFFMIAGDNTDEIYAGYRLLTGATPLLPKGTYGFIQSKQRYSSQAEVLAVAKRYRERHLPAGVLVVDWFYWTKMGQMDFDPRYWPNTVAMNRELHSMGFQTMISVWPRSAPGYRYYNLLSKNGWFVHLADETPTTSNGLPDNYTGPNIDTTNPGVAKWYWDAIHKNFIDK